MEERANQEIEAAGTTISHDDRKICIRTLKVSSSQIGQAYWQTFAVRFSSV
jgi:hypothetical protein